MSKRTVISRPEALHTRPNARILLVEANHPENKCDYPVLAYTDNDQKEFNKNAIPVCYYNGQWRRLGHSLTYKAPTIGDPVAVVETYDLPGEEFSFAPQLRSPSPDIQPDSDRETVKDSDNNVIETTKQPGQLDEQIRLIPIPELFTPVSSPRQATISLLKHPKKLSPISSASHAGMSGTQVQQPSTLSQQLSLAPVLGTGGTSSSGTAAPASSGLTAAATGMPASINAKLRASLRRYTNPPPLGGPPGGSGGGGRGSGPPAGPLQPPPGQSGTGGQAPVAVPADVKAMGGLPAAFDGDCLRADNFIEEVKGFLRLNQDVAGYNSPIKKVAFTLTLMYGPQIAGWKRDVGNFLDTLDPIHNNIPDIWNQFLHEFAEQYQDSQKKNRARAQLENCCMKFPEIDDYISQFEELCCNAGYTQGNNEVFHLFVKGLPTNVMEAVFISPIPADYQGLKDKAIEVTQSRMLVKGILKTRGQSNPGGFNQGSNNFQQPMYQPNRPFQGRRPGFFSSNQGGQGNLFNQQCGPGFRPQGGGQGRPQFNSTNVPRWMANQPIPIDLDRACASN